MTKTKTKTKTSAKKITKSSPRRGGRGPSQPTAAAKRICYFVPVDAYVEGCGFRPSVVVEGEAGHRPTGTWPYTGAIGETRPYFWGHEYKEAEAIARKMNERLGLSNEDVNRIVASSMAAQRREEQEDKLSP